MLLQCLDSFSVVDLDDWDCTFDNRWFEVVQFFDLPYIWCHIRPYFCFDWDLQIFIELHVYPHLRDTHWDDDLFVILSWSSGGVPLESFDKTHTFWHLDVVILLILDTSLLICGSDSTVDLDYRDHTFDDRLFQVTRFPTYHISDAILGHISFSIESYRFSWSYMITQTYGMHVETRACSLFYHDPSVELILSHPVRPVFFGICM